MALIVVLGAGLGGVISAHEIKKALRGKSAPSCEAGKAPLDVDDDARPYQIAATFTP